jgi:hypothetical protein
MYWSHNEICVIMHGAVLRWRHHHGILLLIKHMANCIISLPLNSYENILLCIPEAYNRQYLTGWCIEQTDGRTDRQIYWLTDMGYPLPVMWLRLQPWQASKVLNVDSIRNSAPGPRLSERVPGVNSRLKLKQERLYIVSPIFHTIV